MNYTTLWRNGLLLLALLLVTGIASLMYVGQSHFSPVYDEVANVPSGYNFLTTGRYTDPTHPPLLRFAMAVPLYLQKADPLRQDSTALYRWQDYGVHFLFQNNQPWQRLLGGVRTVNILFTAVLLLSVFGFARRRWGLGAGWAALVLLAFEPSILGHGQLATLDIGHALTYFWATLALLAYLERPTRARWWVMHLALALAFLSKFAALPLFAVAAVGIVYFRKKQGIQWKWFWASPFIFAFLAWGAYLFQIKTPAQDAQIAKARDSEKIQRTLDQYALKMGTTREGLLNVQVPAYDFLKGLGMQVFHALFQDQWEKKESFQYLDGDYRRRGWRTYFVHTFWYKSTLGTLALVLLLGGWWAATLVRNKGKRAVSVAAFCLVWSPVLLFVACSLGTINIGHRYLLPVYPFLALGVGYVFYQSPVWLKTVLALLLAGHVASTVRAYPHYLAYFNEYSREGYHLADSNIDWGQDLLYLEPEWAWGIKDGYTVWGDCFGVVKPAQLGIELRPIPATQAELGAGRHLIFLSVHRFLNRSSVHPQGLYPWLNALQPVRKVGRSILVYEVVNAESPSPE